MISCKIDVIVKRTDFGGFEQLTALAVHFNKIRCNYEGVCDPINVSATDFS